MKVSLTPSQLKTLSEFTNDVAKGLMLAGLLGQTVVSLNSVAIRVVASSFVILLSLLFLNFSLLLGKK